MIRLALVWGTLAVIPLSSLHCQTDKAQAFHCGLVYLSLAKRQQEFLNKIQGVKRLLCRLNSTDKNI